MVMVQSTTKISVPKHVLARELDGESVLLNLDSGDYYGLDQVGTRMWTLLSQSGDVETAYGVLLGEYDASAELLRKDLEELLDDLVSHQLLVIHAA